MSVERRRLLELAEETGFRPETLEKVVRLGELARDISIHPLLGRVLLLKGGTALNLCFGTPRRLSVDLDFNFVGARDRDEMVAAKAEIERAIKTVVQALGYPVQWSAEAHAGRKAYLAYRNAIGARDRIELDLNFLFRVPIAEPRTANLWQPDGSVVEVRIVSPAELCTGKLCAALDRALPRDLFDLALVPSILGSLWGDRRFRRLFVAHAGVLDRALTEYGAARFQHLSDVVVSAQLHPMLTSTNRPTADDLRRDALAVLTPLLDLDAAEREFSERLQRGDLRPDLLFPDDPKTGEILRSHPALRWKSENAAGRVTRR
ncbi:MAG TPA: nucleotidyl transferase AbiEii/AbiGii toxin family protein [Myxococcota bacterium]|nr:nucleotidyl transferase AbiEii/AbiGii toxin family protein [Myxococcota bacterium]